MASTYRLFHKTDVYVYSLIELQNQEHRVRHMVRKFTGQGIITAMLLLIKNSDVCIVTYGEKEIEFYPCDS